MNVEIRQSFVKEALRLSKNKTENKFHIQFRLRAILKMIN